ncbi:MAG: hypothetical protein BroJett018_23450 [Chloroflexota bacterium]|nr:MAG: hypothetical protein BroJett018_23450 [Chloroflexota bacterium]
MSLPPNMGRCINLGLFFFGLKYKKAESDEAPLFMVGFHYHWIDIDSGDTHNEPDSRSRRW